MFTQPELTVRSVAIILDDCPVRHKANAGDGAVFVFGGVPDDDFELNFTTGALQTFVELAITALDELGKPFVRKELVATGQRV